MQSPHRNQPVIARGVSLKDASAAVVLAHGRGASAEDILGLADEFDLPDLAYLAPEAAGHSWYPNSFLAPLDKNEPWLTSALELLGTIVERIVAAGIPHEKIALVGFSQGACLVSEFVAQNPSRYGGLVGFTGGLIGPPGTVFHLSGDLSGTPCFFGSGDPDPHVPWKRVEETAAALSSLGGIVKLKRYPGMPHTISADEISEARKIISPALAKGA
jgi:phospholipase/carboxylesterase